MELRALHAPGGAALQKTASMLSTMVQISLGFSKQDYMYKFHHKQAQNQKKKNYSKYVNKFCYKQNKF